MDSLVAVVIHDAKNALQAQAHWLHQARRHAAMLHVHAAHEPSSAAALDDSLQQAWAINAHLGQRLVELLSLYRASQGQLHLTIEDQPVADFLESVVLELRQTQAPQDLALAIHVDARAAAEIGAWAFDANLVRLVLVDALRNACRHARSQIRLSAQYHAAQGLALVVEDDGPGYPADYLRSHAAEVVSEPGQQLRAPEPNPADADSLRTGLGLDFARLVATHHRAPGGRSGRLELDNSGCQVGGGCLRLWLP